MADGFGRGESDAQAVTLGRGGVMGGFDPLNESRISIATMAKPRVSLEKRYRVFQSMGFQGNTNDALDLICLTLKKLDFDWQIQKGKECKLKCRINLDR